MIKVANIDEIKEGGLKVDFNGEEVLLIKKGNEVYAVSNICTHQEKELLGGTIEGDSIVCPHHGARFDLKTGKPLSIIALSELKTYKVTLKEKEVFLEEVNELES